MKKFQLTLFTVFTLSTAFSQTKLDQLTIQDFAAHTLYEYKYGDGSFKQLMNLLIMKENYTLSSASVMMENLNAVPEYRNVVFRALYKFEDGDYEAIYALLYRCNMKANTASKISNYIVSNCAPKNNPTKK